MSRHRFAPVPLLLAGLLLAPSARAQESAAAARQLLDSLLPLQARLAGRINAALLPRDSRRDTLRAGSLLAMVSGWRDRRISPAERLALQRGLDSAGAILERESRPSRVALRSLRLDLAVADSNGSSFAFAITRGDAGPERPKSWSLAADPTQLPTTLALALGQAAWAAGDTVLTDWLTPSGFALGFFHTLKEDAERTHVRLVTAPSKAVQACQAGDLHACEAALGSRPLADPLRELYAPEERVVLARALFAGSGDSSCVSGGDAAACDSLLRGQKPVLPLGQEARRLLVRLALQLGGPDAADRLGRPGSLGQRLEGAAGMPEDSLVARWRSLALSSRPAPVGAPSRSALSTLCWAGLFGLLALRSSRWR